MSMIEMRIEEKLKFSRKKSKEFSDHCWFAGHYRHNVYPYEGISLSIFDMFSLKRTSTCFYSIFNNYGTNI